ncbi:phage holin family protein [Streptomyces sp. NPDC002889]|uniref:phage holin family protein n=1 Tax=Streptomyces sp. NPDC002889 TaxID=3364669 RepID=UPI00368C9A9A
MSDVPRIRADESVSALVSQAAQQISQLVREEMRLAQAEMMHKGKHFGRGGGLFGGAGLVAVLALQALVAAAIIALAMVLPWWASALIISGILFLVASVLAAAGRKNIKQATPPAPQQTIDSVKADIAELRERAHR